MLPAAYALNGDRCEATRLIRDLQLDIESGRRPPGITTMWISWAHATLGDTDEAFRWLELATRPRLYRGAAPDRISADDSLPT